MRIRVQYHYLSCARTVRSHHLLSCGSSINNGVTSFQLSLPHPAHQVQHAYLPTYHHGIAGTQPAIITLLPRDFAESTPKVPRSAFGVRLPDMCAHISHAVVNYSTTEHGMQEVCRNAVTAVWREKHEGGEIQHGAIIVFGGLIMSGRS